MPAGTKVPDSTAIVLYHFNDVWKPATLSSASSDFSLRTIPHEVLVQNFFQFLDQLSLSSSSDATNSSTLSFETVQGQNISSLSHTDSDQDQTLVSQKSESSRSQSTRERVDFEAISSPIPASSSHLALTPAHSSTPVAPRRGSRPSSRVSSGSPHTSRTSTPTGAASTRSQSCPRTPSRQLLYQHDASVPRRLPLAKGSLSASEETLTSSKRKILISVGNPQQLIRDGMAGHGVPSSSVPPHTVAIGPRGQDIDSDKPTRRSLPKQNKNS